MVDTSAILRNENVSLVPFHWAHPEAMDLRPHDRVYYDCIPNFREYLKLYMASGNALTAVVPEGMACCFGVNAMWPGIAEGWMLTSHLVDGYPVSLTRSTTRYFNRIATEMKLKRLQLTVNATNVVAVRWANALGFTREGVLRSYGADGADHIMFARIY